MYANYEKTFILSTSSNVRSNEQFYLNIIMQMMQNVAIPQQHTLIQKQKLYSYRM